VFEGSPPDVIRIDPRIGAVAATIPLGIGSDPVAITTGRGAAWVADTGDGTVGRIDPASNSLRRLAVGGSPARIAAGQAGVFATVQPGLGPDNGGVPSPIAQATSGSLHALPSSICSPVYAEGKPDVLIAADLPLQGFGPDAITLQMSSAIRFVLAQHGFRAGRFVVGYQLCDDSSATTGGWSPPTCRVDAHAIAADDHVVGMIGPITPAAPRSSCRSSPVAPAGRLRS
jgi:hypothetical protein